MTLAADAVTYASVKGGDVPPNLTQPQLKEIFSRTVAAHGGFAANTWGALLGPSAKNRIRAHPGVWSHRLT